jgi:putative ABC transport system permease protein
VLRLKLVTSLLFAVLRMGVQLLLIGFFLRYLFEFNIIWLNILWFLVMVAVATVTIIRRSKLNVKLLLWPASLSLSIAGFLVLLYFNAFVIELDQLFEAKYFVAIGGMLLGNSLRGNIIGLTNFYSSLKRNENRYLFMLSTGATQFEAVTPYFKQSVRDALSPIIATMATMGIVFLPGMMTGQIIGGSSPLTAVKYQIAIMIAIFTAVTISVMITILLTLRFSFYENGTLKKQVFRETS